MRNVVEGAGCSLVAIMAIDQRGGCGLRGKLPWRLPSDMGLFRTTTLGSPVIVGGGTFRFCMQRRALPGRTTIVVTANGDVAPISGSVTQVNSVVDAIETARRIAPHKPSFVAGGPRLWSQLLPLCDGLLCTHVLSINAQFDTFAQVNWNMWELTVTQPILTDGASGVIAAIAAFYIKNEFAKALNR